jgi:hypothetical protein
MRPILEEPQIWGSLVQKPGFRGSWTVSTKIPLLGRNLEPKRDGEVAPFLFETWICVETGQDRPKPGFGARDPKCEAPPKSVVSVGVPLFGGPFVGFKEQRRH